MPHRDQAKRRECNRLAVARHRARRAEEKRAKFAEWLEAERANPRPLPGKSVRQHLAWIDLLSGLRGRGSKASCRAGGGLASGRSGPGAPPVCRKPGRAVAPAPGRVRPRSPERRGRWTAQSPVCRGVVRLERRSSPGSPGCPEGRSRLWGLQLAGPLGGARSTIYIDPVACACVRSAPRTWCPNGPTALAHRLRGAAGKAGSRGFVPPARSPSGGSILTTVVVPAPAPLQLC